LALRIKDLAMPIYAYRCATCGHAQDVLQKMSDPLLTTCPACGASTYSKQLTAAGFQLKGSGWYVTDFRGGNNGAPAAKKDDAAAGEAPDAGGDGKAEGKAADKPAEKPAEKSAEKPAADKPAAPPASPPAAGGGTAP
jgi:putative FmdB family regulatory protein